MQQNNMKRAMDTDLSSLRTTGRERTILLQNALEGKKVKKKWTAGLVMAIVMILIAATALAATLVWEHYAAQVKQVEHEQGDYALWPIKEKETLVKALMEMGYIGESEETARLLDAGTAEADKHALADQLLLALTGQTDPQEINLDIITYAILGSSDTWTPEQRVWWQGITNMYRAPDADANTFVVPTATDLSEKDAIAIAKAAVLKAYELPDTALDQAQAVADLYTTPQRPDYRRWCVLFNVYREGSSNYVERIYSATVDMAGNVIADPDLNEPHVEEAAARHKELKRLEALPKPPLLVAYYKYLEAANYNSFKWWTLEMRAAFSLELREPIQAVVASGDLTPLVDPLYGDVPGSELIASTVFAHGMPGDGDIAQAEALVLAKQALQDAYGLDANTLALYEDICVYFDITNPDRPLWKFYFNPKSLPVEKLAGGYDNPLWNLCYKAETDARTGAIVFVDEFAFSMSGQDSMEYILKQF